MVDSAVGRIVDSVGVHGICPIQYTSAKCPVRLVS